MSNSKASKENQIKQLFHEAEKATIEHWQELGSAPAQSNMRLSELWAAVGEAINEFDPDNETMGMLAERCYRKREHWANPEAYAKKYDDEDPNLIALAPLRRALWDALQKSAKSEDQAEELMEQAGRAAHIRTQLERFYQPIFLGLWKDQAEWENILGAQEKQDSPEHEVAEYYARNIIIPNHDQIIDVIDTHMLIADVDEHLSKLLQQYKKDVSEYKALRKTGRPAMFSLKKTGSDWWHQELFDSIKSRMEQLEKEYQELAREDFVARKTKQTVAEHDKGKDLLPKLERHFNLEELRTLCFDLGVNYDSISGDNLQSKARELILLFGRESRLEELVNYLREQRPTVNW